MKSQAPVTSSCWSADGVERAQGDEATELVAARVLLQVRGLHATQVVVEGLAGEQALVQAVPVTELDEGAVLDAQLELVAALDLFAHLVGELVALEIGGRRAARPSSRTGCRSVNLSVQEVDLLLEVVDLFLVEGLILLRDLQRELGAGDLGIGLGDLDLGLRRGFSPVVLSAVVAAMRGREFGAGVERLLANALIASCPHLAA